jgi:hypothetical protein
MGMKDRSLINKINQTFITLTTTAIHHCRSVCKTDEFRVQPGFGTGGEVQRRCDTKNIKYAVNNAWTDEFHHLEADFRSFSPAVQAKR